MDPQEGGITPEGADSGSTRGRYYTREGWLWIHKRKVLHQRGPIVDPQEGGITTERPIVDPQ